MTCVNIRTELHVAPPSESKKCAGTPFGQLEVHRLAINRPWRRHDHNIAGGIGFMWCFFDWTQSEWVGCELMTATNVRTTSHARHADYIAM